jgi:hypothetical protein
VPSTVEYWTVTGSALGAASVAVSTATMSKFVSRTDTSSIETAGPGAAPAPPAAPRRSTTAVKSKRCM